MNKTRTYVFSVLLTALMVTACTLEGGIETILEKAGIEKGNSDIPPGSDTINLPPFILDFDSWWVTNYYNYLSAGTIHTYRFYVSNPGVYHLIGIERGFDAELQVALKKEGASSYITGWTDESFEFFPSTSGYYILEVRGVSSSISGNYTVWVGYWGGYWGG